jgi:hypothetical protein
MCAANDGANQPTNKPKEHDTMKTSNAIQLVLTLSLIATAFLSLPARAGDVVDLRGVDTSKPVKLLR